MPAACGSAPSPRDTGNPPYDAANTGIDVAAPDTSDAQTQPDGAVTGVLPAPDASDATDAAVLGCDMCGITVAPDAGD